MAKPKRAVSVDLQGPDLIEHIVSRATEEANKRILDREARRRQSVALIITVLGLIGVSSAIALVAAFIETTVESKIVALREDLVAELGVRDQAALFSLQTLSNKLESSDAFNLAEEKQVIEGLVNVSNSEVAKSSPILSIILQQVIEAFIAADRMRSVETLDEEFRSVILKIDTLVPQICTALGHETVGGSSSPGREPNKALFDIYCDASIQSGFPEIGLLWRLVAAHKDANFLPSGAVEALIGQVPLLTAVDLEAFQNWLVVFSDTDNFVKVKTPQAVAVADAVTSLLAVYPGLAEIQSIVPQADAVPGLN